MLVPKSATLAQARAAKHAAKRLLAGQAEVIGLGLTKASGGYAVKIILKEPLPGSVPDAIDGVPLIVEAVGVVHKRPD